MSENVEAKNIEPEVVAKGISKKFIALIVIGILAIGGAVAAFILTSQTSPKATYFKAEIASYEMIKETFNDRFKAELDWMEFAEENPTESTFNISAEINDPSFLGYGMYGMDEIINGTTLTISAQTDMEKKEMAGEISASFAGAELNDFHYGLTGEELLIKLPFLKDTLQIKGKDLGRFLHDLDPYTFDEDTEYDFSKLFDSNRSLFSDEDKEYLHEAYGKMIYDGISDDSFTAEKEEVTIDGESIKAEKIELHLSEEQFKELYSSVIKKMQSDDRLKEMLKEYLDSGLIPESEIAEIMDGFDEALQEAEKEIEDFKFPDGITSTIWVKNDLIVKREFSFVGLDEYDDEVSIKISGTQMLTDKSITFNYDLTYEDDFDEGTVNISADLSNDGKEINDVITMSSEDVEIKYESEEEIDGESHVYTRTLFFDDGYDSGSLIWEGDTTYEKDQMEAEYRFYMEADDIGKDVFTLVIGLDGKKIKGVDAMPSENLLDIGSMSEDELYDYIENNAYDQFMEWYFDLMQDMDLGF